MKETLNTSTEDGVIKNSMASEEAKEYFKLATPMLLTQLAAHATGIISALMTGNYNTVDQAAVAIGNMLFWPAYFGEVLGIRVILRLRPFWWIRITMVFMISMTQMMITTD